MLDYALPAVSVPANATPPARLIADLARTVTPGDLRTALALAGAR